MSGSGEDHVGWLNLIFQEWRNGLPNKKIGGRVDVSRSVGVDWSRLESLGYTDDDNQKY